MHESRWEKQQIDHLDLGVKCALLGAISLFTTWLHGHTTQQVDPEVAGVITYPIKPENTSGSCLEELPLRLDPR